MIEHQVLFCPFCGECFEGRSTCPMHELALVPYHRVPCDVRAEAEADDDGADAGPFFGADAGSTGASTHEAGLDTRPLALLEPRFGRAPVAAAAILLASSVPLGLAQVGAQTLRTYEVAARFPSLWTWPLVSFCAIYLLTRRRSPAAMRGLRVVVPWLGLVALLTLGLAGARLGLSIAHAPAAYIVTVAGVLLVGAGARLGVLNTRA